MNKGGERQGLAREGMEKHTYGRRMDLCSRTSCEGTSIVLQPILTVLASG